MNALGRAFRSPSRCTHQTTAYIMKYFAVTVTCAALLACLSASCDSEVPAVRSYFYIGGQYDEDDDAGGHIFRDQMYVERLQPVDGPTNESPIVLIHGQGQTGTNFLNKPDGGRGWASRFLEQGHDVYIVDQTLRGRSAWQPGHNAAQPSVFSAERIQQRFTATQKYKLWPQAELHTQWPGAGVMHDPIFDAFYSSGIQFINNVTYQQSTVQSAGAALLDKIGKPAIIIGHSQGGILPLLIADVRPALAKALILLEPLGPPFRDAVFSNSSTRAWGLTDVPITYEPPITNPADLKLATVPAPNNRTIECVRQASDNPRKLANLVDKPILLVTSESSYHMLYDYCSVNFLRQAGCSKVTHLELGEEGIHGNGHMFFMERNSDVIQKRIKHWIYSI